MSQSPQQTVVIHEAPRTSGLAIAGLIFSVLGWFTLGLLCIPGAFLCFLALFSRGPKGAAIAGLIVGFPGTIFFMIIGLGLLLGFLGLGTAAISEVNNAREEARSLGQEQELDERQKTETETSNQVKHASTFDGNISLTLNVIEVAGKRVRLNGTTNLPRGTKLMLSVNEILENGFFGQSSCIVSSKGRFESEAFGPKGGLKDGRYVANVTMPIARVQPEAVKQIIGNKGENLTGPLVENGSFGVTISQNKEFSIGESPDEAQAIRKQKAEEDTVVLRRQLCVYLEQLLEFKDKPEFEDYGFGTAGPYHKWLKDIEALRDAQPKGIHPIPIELRVATGDLLMLGMGFLPRSGPDYTRQMLPEVKEAIDYDAFLAAKSKALVPQSVFRTWRDTSGKFSLEAVFVKLKNDNVVLRKKDGTTGTVPLSKLSTQDIEFIKEHYPR